MPGRHGIISTYIMSAPNKVSVHLKAQHVGRHNRIAAGEERKGHGVQQSGVFVPVSASVFTDILCTASAGKKCVPVFWQSGFLWFWDILEHLLSGTYYCFRLFQFSGGGGNREL